MPSFRSNVTDRQQDQLEEATFDGGSPHFADAKTRVVTKGAPHAAAQRTANAGSTLRSNAGVVMPHDDKPGLNVEALQGKA